jgi:hypothetical protein
MRKVTEARRNPELNTVNRRKDGLDAVRQYLGNDHAFLSMSHMNKVGIKPLFEHTTPMGIYAYPLAATDVIESIEANGLSALPFRGDARFAHIIIADIPDQRMLSVYSNAARLEESLHQMALQNELGFLWPTIMKQAEKKFRRSESQDRIIRAYQASRSLSYYVAMKRAWGLLKMADALDDAQIDDSDFEEFGAMSVWNAILRKCGFDAMTDEGIGYIHHHEETQACFFTTKPFRNVISVELSSEEYPGKAKEIGSMAHLLRLIRAGLDPIEATYILEAMVKRRGTPPAFTEWSYRPSVHPTKGEVDAIMRLLRKMYPNTVLRYWRQPSQNSAMETLWDYVNYSD